MTNNKKFAIDLALEAGAIIKKYFNREHKREVKVDSSPVTIADKTINNLVAEKIKKNFPDHGFIGEEGNSFNEKNRLVWICDPLDGTIAFTHGVPVVSFSLALLENGDPILGIIFNPFADRIYFAEKGKGAFLNESKIKVNSEKEISERNSHVGICVWKAARYDVTKLFESMIAIGTEFNFGSTAYLGALVASGDSLANIFPHTSPWDFAAVKIIVEEAGGRVTNFLGEEQKYNQKMKGALASNGFIHEKLIKQIKEKVNLD